MSLYKASNIFQGIMHIPRICSEISYKYEINVKHLRMFQGSQIIFQKCSEISWEWIVHILLKLFLSMKDSFHLLDINFLLLHFFLQTFFCPIVPHPIKSYVLSSVYMNFQASLHHSRCCDRKISETYDEGHVHCTSRVCALLLQIRIELSENR